MAKGCGHCVCIKGYKIYIHGLRVHYGRQIVIVAPASTFVLHKKILKPIISIKDYELVVAESGKISMLYN